jgi:hypothetical protein
VTASALASSGTRSFGLARGVNHEAAQLPRKGRPSSHFHSQRADMHYKDLGQSGGTDRRPLNRRYSWSFGLVFCATLAYSVEAEVCLRAGRPLASVQGDSDCCSLKPSTRTVVSSSDKATPIGVTASALASSGTRSFGLARGVNHEAAQAVHGWEPV